MLKKLIKPAINSLGIDIVKYPLSPLGRKLRDFLREERINLVVDVGACDGGFCRMLRSECEYCGPIASIEPCYTSFEAVKRKMAADQKWRGIQVALSDSDGEGVLHTFEENSDWNSLHQVKKLSADAYALQLDKQRSEQIILRKFDTLWDDITRGIQSPRVFLKMDTQGHDVNVFKGAKERLPFIIGAQSELPAIEMYEGMISMGDTLKFFSGEGYTPIGFYEVAGPKVFGGAVPEFDVLFKRLTQ